MSDAGRSTVHMYHDLGDQCMDCRLQMLNKDFWKDVLSMILS